LRSGHGLFFHSATIVAGTNQGGFGNESNEQNGCLIDFDFGGKESNPTPRACCRRVLEDGYRVGRGGQKILEWHDWFALGRLIFTIRCLQPPGGAGGGIRSYEIIHFWSKLAKAPTQEEIRDLKTLLSLLEEERWTVEPDVLFRQALDENAASGATNVKATEEVKLAVKVGCVV
jgi:hypothetical protein